MVVGLTKSQEEFLIAHPVADEIAAFIGFDLEALRAATPPFPKGSSEDQFVARLASYVLAAHGGHISDIPLGDFDARVAATALEHADGRRAKEAGAEKLSKAISEYKELIEELENLSSNIDAHSREFGEKLELRSEVSVLQDTLSLLEPIERKLQGVLWPGPQQAGRGRPKSSRHYQLLVQRAVDTAIGYNIPVTASRDPDGRPNCRFTMFLNGLTDAFDLPVGFRVLAEMALSEKDPDLRI